MVEFGRGERCRVNGRQKGKKREEVREIKVEGKERKGKKRL